MPDGLSKESTGGAVEVGQVDFEDIAVNNFSYYEIHVIRLSNLNHSSSSLCPSPSTMTVATCAFLKIGASATISLSSSDPRLISPSESS